MVDARAFEYRVFLSCSDRDKHWAKWLHGALEGYRIDRDLIGRETCAGPVPKTLRPIFRDHADLLDGGTLTERGLAALQASEYLVVICSPNAAASWHVNEQIRRFKALGRADRVIPVIVDGKPGDPERECFPPALHYKLEPRRPLARALTLREPYVTDPRLARDGKELAVQKVVARLIGLGLHEVHRYARETRRRQMRNRRFGVVAALLALTLAYDGGLTLARYQLARDAALLDRTLERAAALANGAVALSRQLGLPHGVSVSLLAEAEDRIRELAALGRESPELILRGTAMLIGFARTHAALGNGELQRARTDEADRLLQRLAAEVPSTAAWQRELAAAHDQVGDLFLAQGRLEEALASYTARREIAVSFAVADPRDDDRQHEVALSARKVGDVLLAQGHADEALATYQAGLAIDERLTAADSHNPRWQQGLLLAQQKVGDVLRLLGEDDTALTYYRANRAAAERLLAGTPGNTEWQRALAAAHVRAGDVLAQAGNAEEALASYRAGHAIVARRAAAEPADRRWQNDLGTSHQRIGAMLEARGELLAALAEYNASLAIAGRLAAADPINAGWQRDLGMAHEHVGDVLRSRGDLAGARAAYEAKKAIIGRLAAADPANPGWLYDLGSSHARIGFVLEARGEYEAAVSEYQACLGVVRRVAAAEPGHAGSQRDLAVSHAKLAANYHRLGKVGQALAELRQARDIMAALVRRAPEVAQWSAELARFESQIEALQGRAQLPATAGAGGVTLASAAEKLLVLEPRPALPPVVTVKLGD